MDFDDIKEIQIQQPGFIKFNIELKAGRLNLYKAVGDKFLPFDAKTIGDTLLNHLRIQPGQYQVHYLKDASRPYTKETVIPFAVKPTETTEVLISAK